MIIKEGNHHRGPNGAVGGQRSSAGVTESPAAWSCDGEGAELGRMERSVRWFS